MPLIVFLGALLWILTVPKSFANAPTAPISQVLYFSQSQATRTPFPLQSFEISVHPFAIHKTASNSPNANTSHDAYTLSLHSARFAHQTMNLIATALSIHPDGNQVKHMMQNGAGVTNKTLTPKGTWPSQSGNIADQMSVFWSDIYIFEYCYKTQSRSNTATDLSDSCSAKVKPAVQSTLKTIFSAPHPAKALLKSLQDHPIPMDSGPSV